jgi:hypothetical protein
VTRRVTAASGIWTILVAGWAVFLWGGRVQMCLGPLNVTAESCRAAMGLPPQTNWDRFMDGPGLPVMVVVVGWLVIGVASRWRQRQRGGL